MFPIAVPPVTAALSVDANGETPVFGTAVSVPMTVWELTVTLFEHAEVTVWNTADPLGPEVTVTDAVFGLGVIAEYILPIGFVLPVGPSLPVHEYVYGGVAPKPPMGTAVQLTFWPVVTEVGEAEQDAVRVGIYITATRVRLLAVTATVILQVVPLHVIG